MASKSLTVLAVVGSLRRDSVTRVVVQQVARQLEAAGCEVDVLDLQRERLPLYEPDVTRAQPGYAELQRRVERADVIVLGTPDYHGSLSGAMKNFLDYFWHEFAGKLVATLVASHEKGLTVIDQCRIFARQCYAWTLPYGVSFAESADVKNGQIVNDQLRHRLEMLARDLSVYGRLLAQQRRLDLAGTDPGFLARHRGRSET